MKYSIIAFLTLLLFGTSLPAQKPEGGSRRERMESLKVAYITKELELSSEEAQRFWPVYNEFKAQEREIMGKLRRHERYELDKLAEADIEKKLNERFALEQSLTAHRQNYMAKFKQVLPIRKVALLYQAEHNFRHEVLQQARRQGPGEPPKAERD